MVSVCSAARATIFIIQLRNHVHSSTNQVPYRKFCSFRVYQVYGNQQPTIIHKQTLKLRLQYQYYFDFRFKVI